MMVRKRASTGSQLVEVRILARRLLSACVTCLLIGWVPSQRPTNKTTTPHQRARRVVVPHASLFLLARALSDASVLPFSPRRLWRWAIFEDIHWRYKGKRGGPEASKEKRGPTSRVRARDLSNRPSAGRPKPWMPVDGLTARTGARIQGAWRRLDRSFGAPAGLPLALVARAAPIPIIMHAHRAPACLPAFPERFPRP